MDRFDSRHEEYKWAYEDPTASQEKSRRLRGNRDFEWNKRIISCKIPEAMSSMFLGLTEIQWPESLKKPEIPSFLEQRTGSP